MDYRRLKALLFVPLFLFRRFLFALTAVYLGSSIVAQVYLVHYASLSLLIYMMLILPMENEVHNGVQIFNESILLLLTGMLFLFTEFVGDPIMRYRVGWWLIYIIVFNLAVNVISLLFHANKTIQKKW